MNKTNYRTLVILAFISCLFLAGAYGQQSTKKEYAFRGKVEKIDLSAKTLTVNGENVPGWMMAMTMTYSVDKDAVLKEVKVGDQITAKVYEGDTKVLYEVKVVPPKPSK